MSVSNSPCRWNDWLRKAPFVPFMDWFLYSPLFPLVMGALSFYSCAYSKEIPVYACYCCVFLYIALFGRDFLPTIGLIVFCYIAPSAANNPGRNEDSVFWASGMVILALFVAIVVTSVLRLSTDGDLGGKKFLRKKRALLSGILVLSASYVLGGVGSGHYFDHGYNNLLFVFLQIVSIFLPYYFISGGVKWEKAPKDYLAWTAVCVGLVVIAETMHCYVAKEIFKDGVIKRNEIFVGWGHYNSMGGLLVMTLPFAFQLACRRRWGWFFQLLGAGLFAGVVLTCSRASILTACGILALCLLLVTFRAERRWLAILMNVVIVSAVGAVLWLTKEENLQWLSYWETFDSAGATRFAIYKAGVEQFLAYPIFGGTFFPTDFDLFGWAQVDAMSAFAAPRWHNTIVQMLASCGIVGLLAYFIHRLQTVAVILEKPSTGNLCVGLSVLAFVTASMLDCHFFNVGPTLFYAMALAFAENSLEK